ncbi:hypothetical protein [Nocardia sp. NPDC057353]|uniref:hypothetical protein n=1 Tax=Nocardia sp. NPDC057353 TaxID=3346104 RepID=UPI00363688BF
MSTPETGTEGGTSAVGKALTSAAAISQAGVTLAVLYYCGQVYLRTWYGYFGIDAKMLDFTIADYLVRSLAGFFPLLLGLIVLGVLVAARRVPILLALHSTRRYTWLRRLARASTALGALLCAAAAVVLVASVSIPAPNTTLPLVLLAGVGLLGYTLYLRSLFPALIPPHTRMLGGGQPVLQIMLLGGVAFLAMVWGLSTVAAERGVRDAAAVAAAGFPGRPAVQLYSTDRLVLPQAQIAVLTIPDSKYRFRYDGLFLLARSPDRYFLIPYTWNPVTRSPLYVVPAGDGTRLDLTPR